MLTLVIQAGGQSRRMGQNKALMPFRGEPLIARVRSRLAPIANEVLVTTNTPESYTFLGVPLVPDLQPGMGALGGLESALDAARHPLVAVVACDMPFANPALFAASRDILLTENVDVVIPKTEHGFEPFHALYRRETCLPAVRAALAQGQMKLIAWFDAVRVRALTAEEIALYDPRGLAFMNVNTPEEWQRAQALDE
jgi:molybdopterin-guanine dinucleotide biosynthesis protein A